jgi:uncharacterized membrane protein YfcA
MIVVFGFGVGILVGMTGIGGGSLMTPLLILVFGVKPVTAIGTDLAYGAVTKTLGGWRHWRQRTVDFALSSWMALGSVPAAVGGVIALKALQHGDKAGFDDTVLIAVGGALLLAGIAMLTRLVLGSGSGNERERAAMTPAKRVAAVTFGLAIGFVLGVTSAGSGSLITVTLIVVFGLGPRQVVGTDVFHAAILLWAAALAHLVAGDIDYGLAGTILLGSLPGVWIGSGLSVRVLAGALRVALGLLLVGAGLALVQKAGASIPTSVIGAFPLAVGGFIAIALGRGRVRRSAPARTAARATAPAAIES